MEERLRKFAKLVDCGSYTAAAEQLHVSQPALSVAISKLERELHTPLLMRGSRSLKLTDAGQLAYAAAKDLGVRLYNLTSMLSMLTERPLTIALGMIDSVAASLFASSELFEALERQNTVSIAVNSSGNLLRAVQRDELDCAFIVEQRRELPATIAKTFVATEPLVLVCHRAQQTATQAAMQHGRLPRFISYDQPSTTYARVLETLARERLTPEIIFASTSPEVMLRLVLLQKGTAALPYQAVQEHVAAGTLTLLGRTAPLVIARRIILAQRAGQTLPAALTDVTHHLQQTLALLHVRLSRHGQLAGVAELRRTPPASNR